MPLTSAQHHTTHLPCMLCWSTAPHSPAAHEHLKGLHVHVAGRAGRTSQLHAAMEPPSSAPSASRMACAPAKKMRCAGFARGPGQCRHLVADGLPRPSLGFGRAGDACRLLGRLLHGPACSSRSLLPLQLSNLSRLQLIARHQVRLVNRETQPCWDICMHATV